MRNSEEIIKIIKDLATENFASAGLRRVDVAFDKDSDGDQVVNIVAILDNPQSLQQELLVGFHRLVLDRIWTLTDAFPLIAFRSTDDDNGITSEAA